ncbi:MAG TPA: hypothetical protein V6C96_03225 [Vampirovibrionales bacterium]
MATDPLSAMAEKDLTDLLKSGSKKGANNVQLKYARLQGYLEGYLDQMAASKDSQEELISKLLSEISDILNPLNDSGE